MLFMFMVRVMIVLIIGLVFVVIDMIMKDRFDSVVIIRISCCGENVMVVFCVLDVKSE